MPQLVLVSEPVTSSRPALHRVPKVSNAFVKKLKCFLLCGVPFYKYGDHHGEFSQPEAELRTDYLRLRCRPGSASGWSRRSKSTELYQKNPEIQADWEASPGWAGASRLFWTAIWRVAASFSDRGGTQNSDLTSGGDE